jgi:guanylate kinase
VILESAVLVITTGPTGSGKTSLALALAAGPGWEIIPTLTTRPERPSDTKAHIDESAMDALDPRDFRFFTYDGHRYATPIDSVIKAARKREQTAIVDWVHPHPEDISLFGRYAIAIVLLPPPDVVAARLSAAGRTDRIERALAEHAEISKRRADYHPPWYVIGGDLPLTQLQNQVIRLARGAEKHD